MVFNIKEIDPETANLKYKCKCGKRHVLHRSAWHLHDREAIQVLHLKEHHTKKHSIDTSNLFPSTQAEVSLEEALRFGKTKTKIKRDVPVTPPSISYPIVRHRDGDISQTLGHLKSCSVIVHLLDQRHS